jgi:hypothetical protein
MKISGGEILSNIGRATSSALNTAAMNEDWQGHFASKKASYEHRADDWILQSNLAARELMQIGRQILSSYFRADRPSRVSEHAKADRVPKKSTCSYTKIYERRALRPDAG